MTSRFFNNDLDQDRMKAQLLMLKDAIKTANTGILKVTNVRTVADIMQENHIIQEMLSEIAKLLKIYFTFPVTSATAERSFSSLRRLKTFLRSTMSHSKQFITIVHTSS